MNVYFISGLGADESAFSKIKLNPKYNIIHLPWIMPFENESIEEYASRMAKSIDINQPFCLVGLSFGGIVAKEISCLYKPIKIIIISSLSRSNQLPWYFKFIAFLNLHKVIPVHWLKIPNPITNWFFGIKTIEEKKLMSNILKQSHVSYLKWSINALLNWKNNKSTSTKVVHIHGSKDRIIPISNVSPDYVINNGRHFMVISMFNEVNLILNKVLD